MNRVQERILAEGFEKAIQGAVSENARANRLIPMSRNENDRDRMLACDQLSLKFGTAHVRHTHIENQTISSVQHFGIQKIPGQCECLGPEAHGSKQSFERLPDGLVIVYN